MPTAKKPVAKKTVKSAVKSTVAKAKVVRKATVKKVAVAKPLSKETPARKVSKASASVAGGGLKQSIYNAKGALVGTITLPKEIFDAKVNNPLMAQAVRVYLANQRRGTVKTKSRGEVKISTRKIYRQKGTGRARHGAASAPIFVGGGIAFGPKPRDYSLKLNQKARKLALFSALTVKLRNGEIKIIKGFEKLEPKTTIMVGSLKALAFAGKNINLLLVTPKPTKDFEGIVKSARNIKGVNIKAANLLNTYEVLKNKNLVLMEDSIESLKETFLK